MKKIILSVFLLSGFVFADLVIESTPVSNKPTLEKLFFKRFVCFRDDTGVFDYSTGAYVLDDVPYIDDNDNIIYDLKGKAVSLHKVLMFNYVFVQFYGDHYYFLEGQGGCAPSENASLYDHETLISEDVPDITNCYQDTTREIANINVPCKSASVVKNVLRYQLPLEKRYNLLKQYCPSQITINGDGTATYNEMDLLTCINGLDLEVLLGGSPSFQENIQF